MMKILCLSNGILDENLGAGSITLGFIDGLRKRGFDITVLDSQAYGIWGNWRRARQYGHAIGMAIEIVRAALGRDFTVIEVYGGEAWLGIWLAKTLFKSSVPIVSHSNGLESHVIFHEQYWLKRGFNWNPRPWFQPSQKWMFDTGFRLADAIIVLSEFDRAYALKQHYQSWDRVFCIESGLPDIFLNRYVSDDRDNTILYCGSWIKRKNIQLISDDVSKFLEDFTDWSFTIVGGEESQIRSYFPTDLQGRVQILSSLPRSDLIQVYDRSAIFLLPSYYESFGLVAAEAMSCGCAVIMNRVGIGASLKHLNQAYILDDPVSPNLYDAIVQLAVDKQLRQRIAANGYNHVQQFTWERSTAQLANTIGALMDPSIR